MIERGQIRHEYRWVQVLLSACCRSIHHMMIATGRKDNVLEKTLTRGDNSHCIFTKTWLCSKILFKKPTDLQYRLNMIYSKFYFPNREFINMTQNSKYAPIFLRYLASLMTATIFTLLVLVDPSRRWLCLYVYEHMCIYFFFPYVGTWHFSLKMDPKNHSLPVLNLMT